MTLASCHSIITFWQTTRTLRLFLSHTLSGQPWQVGEGTADGETVGFETGQGIPAWSLRIEGRLLEVWLHPDICRPSAITISSRRVRDPETKLYPGNSLLS